MGTRRTFHTALALGGVSVCAAGFAAAGAVGKSAPRASTARKAAVIKTKGSDHFAPNPNNPPGKEDVLTLGWFPGTITVHSGQKVTLVDGDNFGDPHVLAISPKKDLPKNDKGNPFSNPVVHMVANEVLNDPSNPNAGFKTTIANRGKNGLNEKGDAIVLEHKGAKVTWFVSAKPGTVLHYFCAIHFWMQGEIKVVK